MHASCSTTSIIFIIFSNIGQSNQPSPNRVGPISGYRKKEQDGQLKDTKAKKRELNQKENSDEAMFVLF